MVVSIAVRQPFRSTMAFVARVVAWISRATRPAVTASSASTLAIPSSTARSGSCGVVSTLAVLTCPAPRTQHHVGEGAADVHAELEPIA